MVNMSECERCPYGGGNVQDEKRLLEEDVCQTEYCDCEKVGGKHSICGWCDEVPKEDGYPHNEKMKKLKRKLNKYDRVLMEKKKNNRLKKIINQGGHAPHIGYIDYNYVDGVWLETGNHIKYPRNSNPQRLIKKLSSHKIRISKNVPPHNGYRRCFDYWWTLY